MTISVFPHVARFSLVLALMLPALVLAADAPKGAPKNTKKAAAPALKFRVQQLHVDNNEGCAVADFDRDGKLDVSAGEFWYAGPDFKTKRPLRKLEPFQKDYLTNCGEHAYDVNGDGFPDIVSGAFGDTKITWYENPGAAGLKSSALWTPSIDRHWLGAKRVDRFPRSRRRWDPRIRRQLLWPRQRRHGLSLREG